jgi:general secretion pathway protein K
MSRKTRNDGYITLAVLLMLGFLAALASTLLALARPAVDLVRIGADDLRLEGLLEGGVTAAGYLLFAAAHAPSKVDGMTLHFSAGEARLSVADEGGRIDINRADPELLAGLFEAVRASSMAPAAFAGRAVDWRDPDAEAAENGAEGGDYASAGLAYGPRNAPFRSVEELRLVLGLSAADFDRLAPYVTVFNLSGMVDPFSAARPVLLAVPDVSKRDLKKLIAAHGAPPEVREEVLNQLENFSDYFLFEPSGVYRVRVDAEIGGVGSEAVEVVLTGPTERTPDFGVLARSRVSPRAASQ